MCYWPPVREVCPNYEAVMFQPWTLTTPDLGYIVYCYIAYLLNPPQPILLPSDVRPLNHGKPLTVHIQGLVMRNLSLVIFTYDVSHYPRFWDQAHDLGIRPKSYFSITILSHLLYLESDFLSWGQYINMDTTKHLLWQYWGYY